MTVTEWLRMLTIEALLQSGSKEMAKAALDSISVNGTEAWRTAARRLVLVYRASIADPVRPHMLEAA